MKDRLREKYHVLLAGLFEPTSLVYFQSDNYQAGNDAAEF